MIIRLGVDEMQGTALQYVKKNKKYNAYALLTARNVAECMKACELAVGNEWIVGVEYLGDIEKLNTITLPDVLLIRHLDCTWLCKQENIKYTECLDKVKNLLQSSLFKAEHKRVRYVVHTDQSFDNMFIVKAICDMNSNVTVTGGHFLRMDGARFGIVLRSDMSKKESKRLPLVVTGEVSDIPIEDIDALDNVVFVSKEDATKDRKKEDKSVKEGAGKKRKKVASSLFTVCPGFDNF